MTVADDTRRPRRLDSISESDALARFDALLAEPIMALGLNVLIPWDVALTAFMGEDEMFTDLVFSMAARERPRAFEEARHLAGRWADPAEHADLVEQRRSARVICGRVLTYWDSPAGEFEEL